MRAEPSSAQRARRSGLGAAGSAQRAWRSGLGAAGLAQRVCGAPRLGASTRRRRGWRRMPAGRRPVCAARPCPRRSRRGASDQGLAAGGRRGRWAATTRARRRQSRTGRRRPHGELRRWRHAVDRRLAPRHSMRAGQKGRYRSWRPAGSAAPTLARVAARVRTSPPS